MTMTSNDFWHFYSLPLPCSQLPFPPSLISILHHGLTIYYYTKHIALVVSSQGVIYLLFLLLLYFVPRVSETIKVYYYVCNGYDGDSETVNELARHMALNRWIATEIRWYKNVVSHESAVHNVALPVAALAFDDWGAVGWQAMYMGPYRYGK